MTKSNNEECLRCAHYGANISATLSRSAWTRITKNRRTEESSCCHPAAYSEGNSRYITAEAMRRSDCGRHATLFTEQRPAAKLVERNMLVRHIVTPNDDDGNVHETQRVVAVEIDGDHGSIGVPMTADQIENLGAVSGCRLQARVGVAPDGGLVFEDWTSPVAATNTPTAEPAD